MSRRRKIETNSKMEEHHGNKGIALLLVIIIVLAGLGATATYWLMSQPSGGHIESGDEGGGGIVPHQENTVISADLSVKYSSISNIPKKVLGELFVTTTCPYCAHTEDDLTSIEGQRGDFYFVSFVADKNRDAYDRYQEISKKQGTPDTEFDGGYRAELGAVDPSKFISDISACKDYHPVPVEIHISKRYSSHRASLSIDVFLGEESFKGSIKAFVIDKNSPWKNVNGESIPNAFVGYLLNKDINFNGEEITETGQWSTTGNKPLSDLAVVVEVYDEKGYGLQAYRIDL